MFGWLKSFFDGSTHPDAGAQAASLRTSDHSRKKLLLFIHGLGGGPDDRGSIDYWGHFARLAKADIELREIYDIQFFSYPSARLTGLPSTSVPNAAVQLHARLETEWREYDTVDIIAHSQGGLVTRRYVADRVKRKDRNRIGRVIFYDTPNMGSAIGKGTELPGIGRVVSQEVLDLAPGSAMLQTLLLDEEASGSHLVVPIHFVVAGTPRIVDRPSAWGIGLPSDYIVIPDRDHTTIIEPENETDPAFVTAKAWLLNLAVRSGDDPAPITEQPLLSGKQFMEARGDDDYLRRFTYWHRAIPFEARDQELAELDDFLDDPSLRFSWKMLCGVGGIGKSRLALEVVLRARRDHWRAGFLDNLRDAEYWERWQPSRPTLLIVDYAATAPDLVGAVLKALAERSQSNVLRRPVRLLLIERYADDPRLDTMLATVRRTAGGNTRRPDLVLAQMDVRHIFERVLGADGEIDAADNALTCIDKVSRRPLFAYLIADALKRGQDVRAWDRDALLNDVISRERDHFWWPTARALGLSKNEFQACETALTLATITGRLPLDVFSMHGDELLPRWNSIAHSQLFKDMTGRPVISQVPALEPDIVGEFFVLNRLAALEKLRMTSGETMAEALIERAWSIGSLTMAIFFSRVRQDFPESSAARAFVSRPPAASIGHVPWAEFVHARIFILGLEGNWGWRAEAQELYQELKALAIAHPHEEIRETQSAVAAYLTIIQSDPASLAHALEMYQDIKALTAHPAGKKIRESQAQAAFNLIYVLSANPSAQAQTLELYQELKALAAAHQDDEEVWENQAKAAQRLIEHLSADLASRTRALELYQELKALAAMHQDNKEIRENQAEAANCLIKHLGADMASRTRVLELYQELQAMVEAHPVEKKILEMQALAACNLIDALSANPSAQAQALEFYQELKALATVHQDNKEVRRHRASAALRLIDKLGADLVTRAQALELYQELKALAAAHQDEIEIRRTLALAAAYLAGHLRFDPATRAQGLEFFQEFEALWDGADVREGIPGEPSRRGV
jgi:hypothetical protein